MTLDSITPVLLDYLVRKKKAFHCNSHGKPLGVSFSQIIGVKQLKSFVRIRKILKQKWH